MYHYLNSKKIFVKIICILFVAAIVLSMAYIVKEANHDCIGQHCPICAHVLMVEKAIEQIGTAFSVHFYIYFTAAIFCTILFTSFTSRIMPSLVSQNVRMNN